MDLSNHLTARAQKWSDGWGLITDDDIATSVRHLADAVSQVRDYPDTARSAVQIDVIPDI